MFLDFDQPVDLPNQFDVCVVGAGPVGLAAAWALRRRNLKVLLLEAGGAGDEERCQSLFESEVQFLAQENLGVNSRFRVFGGNATRWGGQLVPLTDTDFQPRAATGQVGWPFGAEVLEPYQRQVLDMVGIGSADFDIGCYASRSREPLDLDADVIITRLSKWLPWNRRNIGKFLQPAFARDADITVLLHANAVEILLDDSLQAVSGIRVRSYAGREQTVSARSFILSAGPIETSRLLLNSNRQVSAGIGNQHDLVGRFFMDHTWLRAGTIVPTNRRAFMTGVRPFFIRNVMHSPRFELAKAVQEQQGCLAAYGLVRFEARQGSALGELFAALKQYQAGGTRALMKGRYWRVLSELPDVAAAFFARTFLGLRPIPAKSTPVLYLSTEQPPRRESRIALQDAQDSLGLRKVTMQWSNGEQERATMFLLARLFDEQLRKHNLASVHWEQCDPHSNSSTRPIEDFFHHLGGARMSASEGEGVVDPDCRVHGTRNLYVASCAVFPTGGSANPTFTAMALAFRLADNLAAQSRG